MTSKTYKFVKPVVKTSSGGSTSYAPQSSGGGGQAPSEQRANVSSTVVEVTKEDGSKVWVVNPDAGKVNYYYDEKTGKKSYATGNKVMPSSAIPITQQQYQSSQKLEVKTTVNPNEPVVDGKVSSRLGERGGVVTVESNQPKTISRYESFSPLAREQFGISEEKGMFVVHQGDTGRKQ